MIEMFARLGWNEPDESATWIEGDVLEFVEPERLECRLRFVRLDPDDLIGFYAAEILDNGSETDVIRSWTRGRFRRIARAGDTPHQY